MGETEWDDELQRMRRIFAAAVEDTRLLIWEYDMASHSIREIYDDVTLVQNRTQGLPIRLENVPESLLIYIEEKDHEQFRELYRKIDAGETKASCEVWLKTAVGEQPKCKRISYTTLFDHRQQPVCACGVAKDITDRKLAEERYHRLNKQLAEEIIGSLVSSHLDLTRNECLSMQCFNPQIRETFDTASADSFIRSVGENYVSDEKLQVEYFNLANREILIRNFHLGKKQIKMDFPTVFRNGERHWLQGTVRTMRNPLTGSIEAVTYAVDITRQKQNEQLLACIVHNEFDYIGMVHFPERNFSFFYKKEAVAYPELGQVVCYEERRSYVKEAFIEAQELAHFDRVTNLELILKELKKYDSYTTAYRRRLKTGQLVCQQLRYSWFDEGNGELLVVSSDVTAAYEREQQQLRQMQEAALAAERANQAKTEFISRISHDIRTPLSIIKSMTGFALEDQKFPERLQSDLHKIETANTFLLSLINDVLDISKIDSGKIELQSEPYYYGDYISNICNMFKPLCAQKNITFEVETKPEVLAIYTDIARLNQITLNLLTNAVRYTPPGGMITFKALAEQAGNRVNCMICVKDTGIGMSKEFQQRMFEAFTQEYENPERKKVREGSGLGLFIVKRLVELFEGSIQIESAPGRGTEISVQFFAEKAQEETVASAEEMESALDEKEGKVLKGKVLLVEDNEINIEIAMRILESFGLQIDVAENGQAAVDLFKTSRPGTYAAILMDIQMPILTGYEAAEKIRTEEFATGGRVPIVAMTADAFSAAKQRCLAVGMDDYITKPIHPTVLKNTLLKWIGKTSVGMDERN
mgnify:CR=1 FL=1